jgi:alpha-tubulin suppressor-like RCC1 family protein
MAFTISGISNYSGITFTTTQPPPPPVGLFSWGRNEFGQLGVGNTTNRSSPVQIGALTAWSKISAGQFHIMSIKTDETMWSWGRNNNGQLGLGNTTAISSPVQVGALTNWLNVSAARYGIHTIAVKTDGTMWSWGSNAYPGGRLGLGNNTSYSSPKQVGALTNWLSVAGGYNHSLATKTNGTLWAWGRNYFGNLGLGQSGNGVDRNSPVQVGALTNWSIVEAGNGVSFAIKTDGTLWAWGNNGLGRLGLADTERRNSPVQIGALTTWLRVSSGSYAQTAAIKTDGTLWTWGWNAYAQLGLGNTTSYSSPKQIGALTNWSKVSTGWFHCAASKTDGTLWGWGRNSYGQIGDSTPTNRSSPVQVGAATTWANVSAGQYYTIAISA